MKMESTKSDPVDGILSLAKAGAAWLSNPALSAAVELLAGLIGPALQDRRERWFLGLEPRLRKLEEGQLRQLQKNEMFVSTFIWASELAMKTTEKEKLDALRNTVLNAALKIEPNAELQLLFLRYVGQMSSAHILALKHFDEVSKSGPEVKWFNDARGNLAQRYPEYGQNKGFADVIIGDLFGWHLLSQPDDDTWDSPGKDLGPFNIATLGKRFLAFIEEPKVTGS